MLTQDRSLRYYKIERRSFWYRIHDPLVYLNDLPEGTNLLITGSREADSTLLSVAREIVELAKNRKLSIVVGDDEGVDAEVIRECDRLGVDAEVYGAYKRMRRMTKYGQNHALDTMYSGRDREMAKRCGVCIAIWNGSSRGTKITFEVASQLGKPVYVAVPLRDGIRHDPIVPVFVGKE